MLPLREGEAFLLCMGGVEGAEEVADALPTLPLFNRCKDRCCGRCGRGILRPSSRWSPPSPWSSETITSAPANFRRLARGLGGEVGLPSSANDDSYGRSVNGCQFWNDCEGAQPTRGCASCEAPPRISFPMHAGRLLKATTAAGHRLCARIIRPAGRARNLTTSCSVHALLH